MPQEISIAIIGAGPAGLVLALSLLRLQEVRPNYSLSIQISDAATELRPAGAAFALSSNGVRPLRQLGILDDLLQGGKAEVLTAMRTWDAKSKTLLMDAKMPPLVFGQPFIIVSRASLQEAPLARLVTFGVQPQLAHKLMSVSDSENNKLSLEFVDGLKVHGFNYVIGADGVRSRVRDDLVEAINMVDGSWTPQGDALMLIGKTPRERIYPRITSEDGKIALIGDAAHPMSPSIGQGANVANEDAIVLANALLPPPNVEFRGAKWYEDQRRERIKKIMETNEFVGKLYLGETFFWRCVRWLGLTLIGYLTARGKKSREGQAQEEGASEVSNEGGGPMAWIHSEEFVLEF